MTLFIIYTMNISSYLKEFSSAKITEPRNRFSISYGRVPAQPFSLSKAVHLSNSTVRLLVIGKSKVTVYIALRLAELFGQTPAYWLDLQRETDLNVALKDQKIQDILKKITKAKKSTSPKSGIVVNA